MALACGRAAWPRAEATSGAYGVDAALVDGGPAARPAAACDEQRDDVAGAARRLRVAGDGRCAASCRGATPRRPRSAPMRSPASTPVRRQGGRRRHPAQDRGGRGAPRDHRRRPAATAYREFERALWRPSRRGASCRHRCRPVWSCSSGDTGSGVRSVRRRRRRGSRGRAACRSAPCSSPRSPLQKRAPPSRACTWPRCSTASAAGRRSPVEAVVELVTRVATLRRGRARDPPTRPQPGDRRPVRMRRGRRPDRTVQAAVSRHADAGNARRSAVTPMT